MCSSQRRLSCGHGSLETGNQGIQVLPHETHAGVMLDHNIHGAVGMASSMTMVIPVHEQLDVAGWRLMECDLRILHLTIVILLFSASPGQLHFQHQYLPNVSVEDTAST